MIKALIAFTGFLAFPAGVVLSLYCDEQTQTFVMATTLAISALCAGDTIGNILKMEAEKSRGNFEKRDCS